MAYPEWVEKYRQKGTNISCMYVRKEALVSSQIEGTQCTLDDVLNPEIDENANAAVSDVVNGSA